MTSARHSSLAQPTRRSPTGRKRVQTGYIPPYLRPEQELSQESIDYLCHHYDPLDEGKYGWNFLTILTKDREGAIQTYSIRVRDLRRELPKIETKDCDVWFSQNVFGARSRRLLDLAGLRACYVDIDCYKEGEWQGIDDPVELAKRVRAVCAEHRWSEPTEIVFSGRGLQLRWLLARAVPAESLPRWKAVQRRLTEGFARYGADPACVDAPRILRVPGTVNQKSGKEVFRIWPERAQDCVLHFFDELASAVLEKERMTTAAIRQLRLEKAVARGKREAGKARVFYKGKGQSAYVAARRLSDIRTLLTLRQVGGRLPEGGREKFLFQMLLQMAWTGEVTEATFFAKAEEVMDLIDRGWREPHSVLTTLRSKLLAHQAGETVQKGGEDRPVLYTYRTETICEYLQITADEEAAMAVLRRGGISAEERKARRRKSPDLTREKIAEGHRNQVRAAVALHEEGLSNAQIAVRLGVHRSTVGRFLKEATEKPAEESGKRAETMKLDVVERMESAQTLMREEGLSTKETAACLGLSERTILRYARALDEAEERAAPEGVADMSLSLGVASVKKEDPKGLLVAPLSSERGGEASDGWTSEEVWHASAEALDDEPPAMTASTPPEDDDLPPLESYDNVRPGTFGPRRFSARELETVRRMSFEQVMERLDAKWAENARFMPRKDLRSKAYDVQTASGDLYRIVMTGMKFTSYTLDGRVAKQGGGAIDLAQHLLHKDFISTMYTLLGRDKDEEDEELRARWGRSAREAYADLQKSRGGDARMPVEQSLFGDNDLPVVPRLAEVAEDYKAGMDDIPF